MSASTPGLTDREAERANGVMTMARKIGLLDRTAAVEGIGLIYEEALDAERAARAALADAQAAYDDASAVAEMIASKQITREGNKTFVFDGTERRQVTADEARTWLAREVAKDPDVADAASTRRAAEVALEEARDRTAGVKERIGLTKSALAASVSLAQLLSTALGGNQ